MSCADTDMDPNIPTYLNNNNALFWDFVTSRYYVGHSCKLGALNYINIYETSKDLCKYVNSGTIKKNKF